MFPNRLKWSLTKIKQPPLVTVPASSRPAPPCLSLSRSLALSLSRVLALSRPRALSLRADPPHGAQKITDGTSRFAQYELLEWSTRSVGGPSRIRFAERSVDTSPAAAAEWHDWADQADRAVGAPAD